VRGVLLAGQCGSEGSYLPGLIGPGSVVGSRIGSRHSRALVAEGALVTIAGFTQA